AIGPSKPRRQVRNRRGPSIPARRCDWKQARIPPRARGTSRRPQFKRLVHYPRGGNSSCRQKGNLIVANHMTAGCNPAHCCAPLAMASFLPDGELARCALREARLTHQHPLAGDVAAAVVVVCRALINGKPWGDALALARTGRLRQTIQALDEDNPSPRSLMALRQRSCGR